MSGLNMATADEEAAADHRPTQQTGEEYGSTRAKDQRSGPTAPLPLQSPQLLSQRSLLSALCDHAPPMVTDISQPMSCSPHSSVTSSPTADDMRIDTGTLDSAPCVPSCSMHNRIASRFTLLAATVPDVQRAQHAPIKVLRRVQTPHTSPRVAMALKAAPAKRAPKLAVAHAQSRGLGGLRRARQVPHLARRGGPPPPRAGCVAGVAGDLAGSGSRRKRDPPTAKSQQPEVPQQARRPQNLATRAYACFCSGGAVAAECSRVPLCLRSCVPTTCMPSSVGQLVTAAASL